MANQMLNVLFITLDQWRADCLSILAHPCLRTPHIDALAADGVLFKNHFSVAAPCGPARASLLTGLYPHNHRSVRNGIPLDRRHTNIALEMEKLGYQPLLFGFTDTTLDPRTLGADDPRIGKFDSVLPGFGIGLDMPGDAWPWLRWLAQRGYRIPAAPRDMWLPANGPRARIDDAPTLYSAEESESAFLTDAVVSHIRQPHAKPWFMHVSYFRPHSPYIAPSPYNKFYDAGSTAAPRKAASIDVEGAQHPWLRQQIARQMLGPAPVQDRLPMAELDQAAIAQLRANYYGSISECDAMIGRLVEALKQEGVFDKTLIVLTSDHGDMLGDHWLWGAEGYFDEAFQVPLIIRDPRLAKHCGVVDAFTESIDIVPTILDAVGGKLPPQLDGRSLRPFLNGGTPSNWRDAVHWEFDFRDTTTRAVQHALGLPTEQCSLAVIRNHRYKYVHFSGLPALFFDLERDPGQFEDRAGDPAYADRLYRYAQQMLSWRMANEDRTLTGYFAGSERLLVR